MAAKTSQTSKRSGNRLPAEVTSFIGRRHEVVEAKRLLSQSRIVTFTGPGGVGKTRLALRIAADVRRAFPDGVWLVELAALDDPDMLCQTVAEALEIRNQSSRPCVEVLADHLRNRQALLVLDNCEHLLQDCAVLVETLARATSDLRILATSRQALGITGEQTLAVPAMTLPDVDGMVLPLETMTQFDAVRLFTERASAVVPGFAVTEANHTTVERICRRLDGIPLALELAAVRLRALSLDQLLDRLDDRFRLLTAGSRAVLPRHRTLRALIDWSYGLCTEQERLLWARVSVFAGSLDLEAAEEVCSEDGIAREDVLDLVIGLVDKSILIPDEQSSSMRYRLLETIRQYGRERLEECGQDAVMRRRHRDYYRRLAAEADRLLFGPDQVAWFTRLQREHANLRTALEYCFAQAETRVGLEMATDLLYHWITSYYLNEGRSWLDKGLAAESEPSESRARALWADAWLAIIQAEITSAETMLEESRALGESLGLERIIPYAALFSGVVALYQGDAPRAIALYEEAVSRYRDIDDPLGEAFAYLRLCLSYSLIGESAMAVAEGERCVEVCDVYGEGWHRAYALMALGIEAWRQGDHVRAAELEKESLRFNRSLDDLLGVGLDIEVLSWIAATQEKYERAGRLRGVLQAIWESIGTVLSSYAYLMPYRDECEVRIRDGLGEAGYRAALKRGARLPYEEAVAYALEEAAPEAERVERPAETSPLTPRETEIAQLVAQGMSNKEIAATLVIAQRTAEGHIEHILSKLGFSSRAQIAVWVRERNHAAEDREFGDS
ncbi:LuxR C-terminal-related transcriptional regulator [Microtetraspora sp. NBRC 16547]|uniref:ATP-binding protein n=1 Tax=Microtetraspora sp. NBRC 16547 TaxID=3030993 RepID=UPI0024A5882E|nr:LuxR C-terminal-related transcriptional regulator [Microtetraspora sp. NBRC 16547]GLX01924.1 LuxR family transcriptional regulator [Microtetraspora sp. NBRC 16547]